METRTKQPGETLDYMLDMTKFFDALPDEGGDEISTVSVSADTGITLVGAPSVITEDGRKVKTKQWISGGTSGESYKVTFTVTTEQGRVVEFEFKLKVKEL